MLEAVKAWTAEAVARVAGKNNGVDQEAPAEQAAEPRVADAHRKKKKKKKKKRERNPKIITNGTKERGRNEQGSDREREGRGENGGEADLRAL